MSPEGTAEVIPYLRFDGCRKFRKIFDAARQGSDGSSPGPIAVSCPFRVF